MLFKDCHVIVEPTIDWVTPERMALRSLILDPLKFLQRVRAACLQRLRVI